MIGVGLGLGLGVEGRGRGGVLFSDSFNRPNSVLTLRNADTGQPWVSTTNWGIDTNQAYCVDPAATSFSMAELGMSDLTISVDIKFSVNEGLVLRYTDSQNQLLARINSTGIALFKNIAGVNTNIGSYNFTPVVGTIYNVKAVCGGSSIIIYLDGVSRITATETFNQTATKHGMKVSASTAGKFDNITTL